MITMTPGRALRRATTFAMAAVLAGGLAVLPAQFATAYDFSAHSKFQGDTTAMGQTNGPVLAVSIAGGKIFAGGTFTSTRPQGAAEGTGETGQSFLAAYDSTTGAPLNSFAPKLTNNWTNGKASVRAMVLSPDKSVLYVGGDFNMVNGQRAEHVAKFDVATGQFLGQVGVNGVNGNVNALAISPDGQTLFVGGNFNKANWGVARNNLAAFNVNTGALLSWQPQVSNPVYAWTLQPDGSGIVDTTRRDRLEVQAIAVSGDGQRAFIGGTFQTVNGVAMQGFAATKISDSSLVPGFRGNYNMPNTRNWTTGLATKDGRVYTTGRADLPDADAARNEGVVALNDATGAVIWDSGCKGDSFAVLPVDNDVYYASHTHWCEKSGLPQREPTIFHSMGVLNRDNGIMRPYWVYTGGSRSNFETLWLSRALASDGNQLVMGGGYATTNGRQQSNISRFSLGSSAPSRAAWPSGNTGPGMDHVRLTILLGADYDDMKLTYSIYRNASTTNPIGTWTQETDPDDYNKYNYWNDYLPSGTKVFYRVKITDPAGNETWSVRTPTYTVGQSGSTTSLSTTSSSLRTAPSSTTLTTEPTTTEQKAAQRAAKKAGLVKK